ncbi:hypothetical protein EC968_000624 [Mortierella alpina]|nr:hypothetical protein EC968_000624 [Mortierella alpina]
MGQNSDGTCGIQYDPANGGKWRGIGVSPNVTWRDIMFWTEKEQGSPLTHVSTKLLDTSYELHASVFNSTLGAFEVSSSLVPATKFEKYHVDVSHLAYGGGQLFVTRNTYTKPREIHVEIFPMKDGAFPPDSRPVKSLNNIATVCDTSVTTFVVGDIYHLICNNERYDRKYLITSDGNTIQAPVEIKSRSHINIEPFMQNVFLPMGPERMPPTWAFYGERSLLGLSLSGDRIGALENAYYSLNVSVPDNSLKPTRTSAAPAAYVATDMLTTVLIAVILGAFFLTRSWS